MYASALSLSDQNLRFLLSKKILFFSNLIRFISVLYYRRTETERKLHDEL